MTGTNDPMEGIMRAALTRAGLRFKEGDSNPTRLDFLIMDHSGHDLHIEVKQFHSDRIAEQMSRAPNVIAVQGRHAVEWLANLIAGGNA